MHFMTSKKGFPSTGRRGGSSAGGARQRRRRRRQRLARQQHRRPKRNIHHGGTSERRVRSILANRGAVQHTACGEPCVLHGELVEPEVTPATGPLLSRRAVPAVCGGALHSKPIQELGQVGRVVSLGFKSQWQKENEPRDVIAIFATFAARSRSSSGTTRSGSRVHVGGQ